MALRLSELQTQAQLRQEIDESHKQVKAQQESYLAEQSKRVAQTQLDVGQKVQKLLETLGQETKRRQGAEQQHRRGDYSRQAR